MKNYFFLLLVLPACFSGYHQPFLNKIETYLNHTPDTSGFSKEYMSRSDAEKILGEPVKLESQSDENTKGIFRKKMTFTALEGASSTNLSVNLFCSLDRYTDSGSAKNAYLDIVQSNSGMPGHNQLAGIGANAWYHSDNTNFCLIIVREKEYLLRLKVNKLTSKFSLNELKTVSARIVSNL